MTSNKKYSLLLGILIGIIISLIAINMKQYKVFRNEITLKDVTIDYYIRENEELTFEFIEEFTELENHSEHQQDLINAYQQTLENYFELYEMTLETQDWENAIEEDLLNDKDYIIVGLIITYEALEELD